MSAILKTPMIQTMLAEMSTAQVSSMLAMMDTDQVPTDYTIGMASGGIPTTLATNPSFVTISMKQFYVMKTTADTPDTADLRKETKKVTGALYQPTAGTPNYSFIEFGQDICRFWAFINGQALIVPETLSTVELRAEVLKRELENFSTAISCDAQGNVEIGKNLHIDKDLNVDGNLQVNGVIEQNSWKFDTPIVIESNLPSGVSCYYGHARVSNGKLNIVIALCANNTNIASSTDTSVVSLTIPEEIGAKLYAFAGQTLDSKVVSFHSIDDNDFLDYGDAKVKIDKASNTSLNIRIFIKNTTTASYNCNCRAEFNFILS